MYIGHLEVHYIKVLLILDGRGPCVSVYLWLLINGQLFFSQTEQIYEAYREKRKLRDEASKVIKECKSTPGTKEAKESLVKATHDFRKYTEVRSTGRGK